MTLNGKGKNKDGETVAYIQVTEGDLMIIETALDYMEKYSHDIELPCVAMEYKRQIRELLQLTHD